MSLLKTGQINFNVYSKIIVENFYITSFYVLKNEIFYFEIKNLINLNSDPSLTLLNYYVDLGDGSPIQTVSENQLLTAKYTEQGTYNITYSAIYSINGNNQTVIYNVATPINVYAAWEVYAQNTIRLNDEIELTLPYTREQIHIQPNEWGVADVFNTSVLRIQECLQYLLEKTQTISTYSPTLFYGWLGNYSGTPASKLTWVMQTYNSEYLDRSDLATIGSGNTYFNGLVDSLEYDDKLVVIDYNKLRLFKNSSDPEEIFFTNGDQLSSFLINPVSIDYDYDNKYLYISDAYLNTIYKLQVVVDENNSINNKINIELFVGGFGGLIENNSFNNPVEIKYKNNYLYVLDYNNNCVKQYNSDLNWVYTYYINTFATDMPISIAALSNGLLYVLTENYNVYIFDNFSNTIFETFSLKSINDASNLLKISFTQNEDFFYILTEQNVFKFSLTGSYISVFNIPKKISTKYNNIKTGKDNKVLIISNKCLFKTQDVLIIYRIGRGQPFEFWSYDQITVNENEFVSDIVYNKTLLRLNQNIKSFRNILNAKFVIANEITPNGVINYFSYVPIDYISGGLTLSDTIENETIGIGVNELHVPPVVNKQLDYLYDALLELADFLSIKNYSVKNSQCINAFCWSWKATSCYNLTFPVIKTCDINPITYVEMKYADKGYIQNYAPSSTWKDATSQCCKK